MGKDLERVWLAYGNVSQIKKPVVIQALESGLLAQDESVTAMDQNHWRSCIQYNTQAVLERTPCAWCGAAGMNHPMRRYASVFEMIVSFSPVSRHTVTWGMGSKLLCLSR